MVPQNLFMLALFGDFYYKTYVQKSNKKSDDGRHKKNDNDDDNNNSPAMDVNNNGMVKTMVNGNGITCKNNVNIKNNCYATDKMAKSNGISLS